MRLKYFSTTVILRMRHPALTTAYTAEADEKRIGMISFIINELTGVMPVEIGDALFWEADQIPVDNQQHRAAMPVEELSSLIEKTSARLIRADLENWHGKLRRARARDEERLKAYYGTISSEISSTIESRRLMGDSWICKSVMRSV